MRVDLLILYRKCLVRFSLPLFVFELLNVFSLKFIPYMVGSNGHATVSELFSSNHLANRFNAQCFGDGSQPYVFSRNQIQNGSSGGHFVFLSFFGHISVPFQPTVLKFGMRVDLLMLYRKCLINFSLTLFVFELLTFFDQNLFDPFHLVYGWLCRSLPCCTNGWYVSGFQH